MKSAFVASLMGFSLLGVDGAYDEARAIEYSNFAGAAYCLAKNLINWNCGKKCHADVSSVSICRGATTKAWLGLWEGKPIVSFEGTHDVLSALQDLRVWKTSSPWSQCNNCHVHDGFLAEYNSLTDCVQQTLGSLGFPSGSKIRTTGHSLGAAINSLAMVDLEEKGWIIEESYDFGRPRVGDEMFARTWTSMFNGRAWRVTHARDPVPQVPDRGFPNLLDWHWEHAYPEVFYRRSLSDGYVICTDEEDSFDNCAEKYRGDLLELFTFDDHLHYLGVDFGPLFCPLISEEEVV